jgi:predicted HicB family RNase H-like nuclease
MPKQQKQKKAGRPPLPKGSAKAGTLRVRVTPDELHSIELAAKSKKQTVSDWIRDLVNITVGRQNGQKSPK